MTIVSIGQALHKVAGSLGPEFIGAVDLSDIQEETTFAIKMARLAADRRMPTKSDNENITKRLRKVAQRMQTFRGGSTGLTRGDWTKIAQLLGHFQTGLAWHDESGALLACSNEYLERMFRIQRSGVNAFLKKMRQAGFLMLHNPKGNFARKFDSKNNKRSSGYSLLPLYIRLRELESEVRSIEHEETALATLKGEIRYLVARIYTKLKAFADHTDNGIQKVQADLARLTDEKNQAFKENSIGNLTELFKGLTMLETHTNQAILLAEKLEKIGHQCHENRTSKELHAESSLVDVKASEEGGSDRTSSNKSTTGDIGSDFGIGSCGITPREARHIFPKVADYQCGLPRDDESLLATAYALTQKLDIHPNIWRIARETMGSVEASYAMLITAQRYAEHTVHSPAAYYNGMVQRGIRGQLDLGKSIFGFRAKLDQSGPCIAV